MNQNLAPRSRVIIRTAQQIELDAIDALCDLFDCSVCELFEWVVEDNGE